MKKIGLFDLDGVLIHSEGYRLATIETLNYLTGRLGVRIVNPLQDVLDIFEGYGISSEWERLAICAAIILDKLAFEKPLPEHDPGLNQVLDWYSEHRNDNFIEIDLLETLSELENLFSNERKPCEMLLKATATGVPQNLFNNIYSSALREDLFINFDNISKSDVTRHYQNLLLGSTVFEDTFNTDDSFRCDSYLLKYDKPAINKKYCEKLNNCPSLNNNHYAIITARPDKPLNGRRISHPGTSPEGQFALQVLDVPEIPLIGYGSMVSAAHKYGVDVERLVKPSGFHTLCIISTLAGKYSNQGMDWAYNLSFGIRDIENTQFHKKMMDELKDVQEIHVFEDTFTGIKSAEEGTELLRSLGFDITLYKWGITQNETRAAMLGSYGADILPTINEAIEKSRIFDEII